jgi:tetratricopeptide (TPR) repeat protein/serine phosphatase RsbU (regulator of sigma subunit)
MQKYFRSYISLLFIFCFFILMGRVSKAQSKQIDSLKNVLKVAKQDTDKLKIIHTIAWGYQANMPDTAIAWATKELQLAIHSNQKLYIGKAHNVIGVCCMNKGNYPMALEHCLKALNYFEGVKNNKWIVSSYNNIGIIYSDQSNYSKALEYYLKILQIPQDPSNQILFGYCYTNMGVAYYKLSDFEKALLYYKKALTIFEKVNSIDWIASSYINLGIIYQKKEDYKTAINNYLKALNIKQATNDKQGVANCYINISALYIQKKEYKKAKEYAALALTLSKEIKDTDNERLCYSNLAKTFENEGNYKEAYLNHIKFKQLTDSIFNAENSRQLGDLKTQFEVEKKETELKVKAEKQEVINAEERKRQKFVIYGVVFMLLIVFVFSILLYKRFKLSQNQNKIIEQQKHLVEEKNKEITDSITYAKRLQQAILPPQEYINHYLPQNFVLYKPKDIVAGDFYWAEALSNEDGCFFIASADSTGHGVPGAMVSVVCSNALNRAVKEFQEIQTGNILNKTRELVIETFAKSSSDVKDGMDISLLSVDKKNKKIFWSGANNPLWYIQNNELKEITANKQPIGKTDNPTSFTTHEISYQENTIFYLFTDGFADQFGGPKGKKFKYKQLSEIILNNHHLPLSQQAEILNKIFDDWKGVLEQVDDVCIIGIRL